VVLPLPVQGFATVDVVPAGCDGVADAAVEVEPLAVVLGELEAVVLPMLLLVLVQGATVVVVPVVPVVPPVTLPALPAVLELPEPIGLAAGCEVCRVPELPVVEVVPDGVEVVPGCVEVVPGEVDVVPGWVDVLGVLVCPMPGLGVTVPVVCAVAIPMDNANTDAANRIFFINLCSSLASAA
jgi:hypothetical protein